MNFSSKSPRRLCLKRQGLFIAPDTNIRSKLRYTENDNNRDFTNYLKTNVESGNFTSDLKLMVMGLSCKINTIMYSKKAIKTEEFFLIEQ